GAQRERARLRIGNVSKVANDLLDPLARLFVEQRRPIDYATNGLLRYPRQARDVVDCRLAGAAAAPCPLVVRAGAQALLPLARVIGCTAAAKVPQRLAGRSKSRYMTPVTK